MRVIAGVLAGGIYPVGVAMVGDLVPDVHKRQVAIGQLLAVALTGNLIGATISGVIGDLFGWRGVFFSIGGFGLVVAVIAFFAFRGMPTAKPKPFNLAAVVAGFRSVFADPRAKVCFGSVFFEGIVIHGMFPYVALLLLLAGQTHSSFAGTRDRRLRARRHRLFARRAARDPSLQRAAIDADRRGLRGRRFRADRAQSGLVCAGRRSSSCSASAFTCCTTASSSMSPI